MRTRVKHVLAVIKSLTLASLTIVTGAVLWFSPLLWFLLTAHSRHEFQIIRYLFLFNFLIFWRRSTTVSVRAILAIRAQTRQRVPEWILDVDAERHPAVADVIHFLEESLGKASHGAVQFCLTFLPVVEYKRSPSSAARPWQLRVGLLAMGLLSSEELQALAFLFGVEKFQSPTPAHRWLTAFHRRTLEWRLALPPHPGWFSFTHSFLDRIAKILEPVARQQREWSFAKATGKVPVRTLASALFKIKVSVETVRTYTSIYQSALDLGSMPPLAEGFFCACTKLGSREPYIPFSSLIDGLWAYERKFVRVLLGDERSRDLRLVTWDDLTGELVAISWKKNAALLRRSILGRSVADVPELVAKWRRVIRESLGDGPWPVTPDVQKQRLVMLLASAFAASLLDLGWQLSSSFGEEITLAKDGNECKPFRWVRDLAGGSLTAPDFIQKCQGAATADLPLFIDPTAT